jgi:hypothetical protein
LSLNTKMSRNKAKGQATSLQGSSGDRKTTGRSSKPAAKIFPVKSNRKLIAEKRQQKSHENLNHSQLRKLVKQLNSQETTLPESKASVRTQNYVPPKNKHSPQEIKQIMDISKEFDDQEEDFDPVSFSIALGRLHLSKEQISTSIALVDAGVKASAILEPLVKNHIKQMLSVLQNDEDTPQHPIIHDMPYFLTLNQIKVFKNNYPHLLLTPTNKQQFSNTPLLHDLYDQFSSDILNYLHSLSFDHTYQLCEIKTRYTTGLPNIWSCKPIESSIDVCEQYEHSTDSNYCNHQVLECDCVEPNVYISNNSIYSFTPHEIGLLVLKSKNKLLVASHHVFEHAFGSILGNELEYLVEENTVRVTINGVTSRYSNMHWLRSSNYHFYNNKQPITLAWKTIKKYKSSAITMFTTYPGHVPNITNNINLFIPAIQNETYYGDVDFTSALNDQKLKNVVGEHLELDSLKLFSWGSYAIMFNTKTKERFYAPKQLVNHMSMYIMGKKRTSDSFINALGHCRIAVKHYNIPPEIIVNSAFAATCLGFVSHIVSEIKIMHSVVKPVAKLLVVHTDAISMKFSPVVDYATVSGMALLAAGVGKISGLALAAIGLGPLAVGATVGAAASAAVAVGAAYLHRQNQQIITNSVFQPYIDTRASLVPKYRNFAIPITKLPATPTKYTIQEIEDIPIDRTAKIRINDLETERKDHEPITVAGIITTHSLPIVAQSSATTSVVSIKTRPLTPQLVHTVEFSPQLFQEFYTYSIKYFNDYFPDVEPVQPKSFREWNSNFTGSQQKIHTKAYQDFNESPSDRINTCGSFPKMESVIKSNYEESIKYCPRNIASRDPQHNVITGPFMHAMSNLMCKTWSVNNDYGVVYTSKVSADDIGAYFHGSFDGPNRIGLEGDFERYDTTIHIGFLRLEIDYYSMCGASEVVLQSLERSIDTVAFDKNGNKFSVEGVRHSGDPNTSCGNTLIQVLAATFCLAKALNPDLPLRPKEIWKILRLRSTFLGDDSSMILDNRVDLVKYTLLLRGLGLNLKPKVYTSDQAKYFTTFCSARFYPVKDELDQLTTVLSPPIARVFTKAGNFVDIPTKLDPISLVKGDALSRLQDCHAIPFLSDYWHHIIKLLSNVQAQSTSKISKDYEHKYHIKKQYKPCDETWDMLYEVYHLTKADHAIYLKELQKITSLPHILDLPMFQYAIAIDGMCNDSNDYFPQVQDIGFIDIPLPDMTEVPEDTFKEQCAKYCPVMIRKVNHLVSNEIDFNNFI